MLDIRTGSQAVAGHSTQAAADPASKIDAAVHATDSSKNGLSSAEANRRLAQYGRNALEDHTESKWHKLLSYFWGPLPFLIEAAAVISAVRRDWPDFIVVTGLLILFSLENITYSHLSSRLNNKKDAFLKNLSPGEINQILKQQQSLPITIF